MAPSVVALGGDPPAIATSAQGWLGISDWFIGRARDVRSCRAPGFDGDEGARFDAVIDRRAIELDEAGSAWRTAGRALSLYADRLADCQRRLSRLAEQVRDERIAASVVSGSGPNDESPATTGAWTANVAIEARVDERYRSRAGHVLAEHAEAVRLCRAQLDAARRLLPRVESQGAGAAADPRPGPLLWRTPQERGGLGTVAAALKTAAGQSALITSVPHVTSWDDFFAELDSLLGTAGLALAVIGIGGGSGGAGLALAGGAVVASPPVAATGAAAAGAAAAGVGLAILIASIVEGESPGEVISDALNGNKIAGKPEINMHDLAELNRSKIPPDVLKEVDDAIARAKIGKKRFPGHDGEPWLNKLHQLPTAPQGHYREWTAAPNSAGRGWDQPNRIIIAGDATHPDAIYYWDHTKAPPVYIGP